MLLVHAARKQRLNVFVETSGRDIAMYKYIDEFFPVRAPTLVPLLRKVVSKRPEFRS